MKKRFDKKTLSHTFKPGDHVLVLLPVIGSSVQATFSGPYEVEQKLSDTDYVIKMSDREKKSCVCHVNMLKQYSARENSDTPAVVPATWASPVVSLPNS